MIYKPILVEFDCLIADFDALVPSDADKHVEQHGIFFVIVPSYDIFSEQLLYLLVPSMFGHSPLWILCSYWRKQDLMENKKVKHSG